MSVGTSTNDELRLQCTCFGGQELNKHNCCYVVCRFALELIRYNISVITFLWNNKQPSGSLNESRSSTNL